MQCKIVHSKLKSFHMIIFHVFSGVSLVESWLCTQEKSGIKLAFVSVSHVTRLSNPKEQPFCFIK